VTVVLLALNDPGLVGPSIEQTIFYVTGALTAIAGLQYMYRGLAWLQQLGAPQSTAPAAHEERDRRRA
jgi:hypothetical protein